MSLTYIRQCNTKINKLEDRTRDYINENTRNKMLEKNISGTIVLWCNIKESNVYIIETPVGDRREIGAEEIFTEVIVEILDNIKNINPQIKETQCASSRIHIYTLHHTTVGYNQIVINPDVLNNNNNKKLYKPLGLLRLQKTKQNKNNYKNFTDFSLETINNLNQRKLEQQF